MSRPIDPRLLRLSPSFRRLLGVSAVLQIVLAALTITQAVALAETLDAIVHLQVRAAALVVLAAAVAARAAVSAMQDRTAARLAHRSRAEVRSAALAAVRRLGPSWAARQPSGRLATAAGPGLEAMDPYLTKAIVSLVSACVVPAAVVGWLLLTDWRSALIVLVLLPLVPLFMVLVGTVTGRRTRRQYEMLARLSGHFLDLVSGLTSLRIYGAAQRQVRAVRESSERYRRHTMSALRSAFLSGLVLDLLATLSVAIVAVEVGLRLDHGSVGLTTALIVLLLVPELFAPLRAVGAQYHASQAGATAIGAALAVVSEAESAAPKPAVQPAERGVISARGLTVRYPDREPPALRRLDLDVLAGDVVALQGRSGAGKSSLLAVVLGFVAADEGSLAVGAAEPSRNVAWVPQRPRPTQPTVAAEVALGDPGASAEQVQAALAACHAPHPQTILGEGGAQLSAGQKRRVALARALLRARAGIAAGLVPIVVLDEPSEDLDALTEQVVVSVLAELAGHATVLVATHSAVLAAAADRIVTLRDGEIVSDRRQRPVRCAVTPLIASPARPVPATDPGTRPEHAPVRVRSRGVLRAGLLSGAAGLTGLALTACSIWLIARAAQHPNVQALALAVVGVRTFALGRALLRYVERLAAHDAALRTLTEVRAQVSAAIVALVPGTRGLRRGDLLRRFVVDVDGVQDGLVGAVVPGTGAAITAAGAVALAAAVVPAAGAILAAGLAVAMVAVPALVRSYAGDSAAVATAAARRDDVVQGVLDGLGELEAYGAAAGAISDVRAGDDEVAARSRRRESAAAAGTAATGLASAATLAAVLGLAGRTAAAGAVSGVNATVLAAAVLAGFEAAAAVPAAALAWARFRAGTARVAEVLAAPVAVAPPLRPRTPVGVGVSARDAAVTPAPDVPAVLEGIDLDLSSGRRVAVMGPSGCGKSTLLAAALRLAPVTAGELEIGGVPVQDVDPAAIPGHVAGSLQGDHVFDATLRDNLRVVRPEATDAELDAAARTAGLSGFVASLPDGWSTPAGPDGALLSSGQRQRLLLARALLADPDVLVLDEPAAHLDEQTAREVLGDVLAGTRGRTVLLTTHRPLPPGTVDDVVLVGTPARPPALAVAG